MTLECCVPVKEADKFRYVIEVVFEEFLGVSCQIKESEGIDSVVFTSSYNSKKLVTNNVFLAQDISTLSNANLPGLPLKHVSVDFLKSGLSFKELPVLFGSPGIHLGDEGMYLEVDILGGIFYSLSRYEELLVIEKDEHARFTAFRSTAYKTGTLNRPIVDEYVEFLWACLIELWPKLVRVKRKGNTYVSCDVDQPFDTTVRNRRALMRTCFSDIVKRKSVTVAAKRIRRYLFNRNNDYRFDPFYTFDWYMDVCETAGLKVAFYFIPTSVESQNGSYELTNRGIEDLLIKIDSRGHEIGVHGSYQTYLDGDKLLEQKLLLEHTLRRLGIDQRIKGNRQHYLRWDSAVTPELVEQAGFEYDTTGGFADHAGFRYGTAREFSMWSWKSKKKMLLKQRPLVAMDCTIIEECYMGLGKGKDCIDYISELNKVAKYNGGSFSLLWHNSNLITKRDKELFATCISHLRIKGNE